MSPVLLRLTWRHVKRRRLQSLLFVAGIALGVAVGVAIDLANTSASRAFHLSASSVTGRTTHQIVGNTGAVTTNLYREIRVDLGIRSSAPVIDTYVRAINLEGRSLRLLGIDPFADAPFRDYLALTSPQGDGAQGLEGVYTFLVQPNTVLVSADFAQKFGLKTGDAITLQTRKYPSVTVHIAGLLYPQDNLSKQAFSNLLLADIATAQELAGEPGRLSRIDLILPKGFDLSPIEELLPPGAVITTPSESNSALDQMTNAFEINLQALGLLAMLVGVFLIYNTVTFSVVQRRPVIGILRSLGTTRRQIFVLIVTEALILGAIGTVAGLALGIVLGQGTVRVVSQTINDLYFRVNVEHVDVSLAALLKGAIVGMSASVVAALVPSFEATHTLPAGVMRRSSVEQGARRLLPLVTLLAFVFGTSGVALLAVSSKSIALSFVALMLVIVGAALLTPLALVTIMRGVSPLTSRLWGVIGRMAPRAVVRSLSRTAVAVAALTLAVSVIVGVSVMIKSFRTTLTRWLDTTLGADIFISPLHSDGSGIGVDIDPALVGQLAKLDGVARVATVRTVSVIAPDYPDLPPVTLVSPNADITNGDRGFVWNTALDGDYWAALIEGKVIVSEPFAFHRQISRSHNTITLLTDRGPHSFTVAGVFYDYTSDQGVVMMEADVYQRFFDDPYLSALALDLQPGTAVDDVLEQLRTAVLNGTGLEARSNRTLRQNVLDIFDRTFAITVALRLLATLVAFIGILSALMALQLEHSREYGVMRANGMTPKQIRSLTFAQTGLMGMTAGILAMPVGLLLALILVYVINVRSFGWSMDLTLSSREFVQAFFVAVIAALAAGIYPAWRLSRTDAAEVLRSE